MLTRSSRERRILLAIFMLLFLQASLTSVQAFSGSIFSDPISTHQVTVDGKWDYPDEWSDAVRVALFPTCNNCATQGYLYAKHDQSCFYFLIDFVSATTPNSAKDGASIAIDSAHDGGLPNSDDRRFDAHYPAGGAMSVGTGEANMSTGNPLPSGVHVAASLSTSPNSAEPHEIFEFKIMFSAFPNPMQNVIGFAASAYSTTQLALWPTNYSASVPSTWGEATLSGAPIPEFNLTGLLAAVALMLPLLIYRRLKTKTPVP